MSLLPAFNIGVWNAWLYMSVFIVQTLVMFFAGRRIWAKSHVPAEFRQTTLEKKISTINTVIWLAAIAYSLFLPLQPGTIWFYSGTSLFLVGALMMILGTVNFISTPSDQLITGGLYKFSRNPLYLAAFFICLGTGIAAASWLFISLSILMMLCFHQEVAIEERYCLAQYKTAYQHYLTTVPRWLGYPGLKR